MKFLLLVVCMFIGFIGFGFGLGKRVADHWYANQKYEGLGVSFSSKSDFTFNQPLIAGIPFLSCSIDSNGHVKAEQKGKTKSDCVAALIKSWQDQSVEHLDEWDGWDFKHHIIPLGAKVIHGT